LVRLATAARGRAASIGRADAESVGSDQVGG
jgi:hypothetical protein